MKNDILEADKVWVTVECTVNTGNYENVKISMGQSTTVGDNDDPAPIRRGLCNLLLSDISKYYIRVKEQGIEEFQIQDFKRSRTPK